MDKIVSGFNGYTKLSSTDITPQFGLHAWLCVFMSSVGLLKASGFLRHKNSRLVGVLELVAGAFLLPAWPQLVAVSTEIEAFKLLNLTTVNLYLWGSAVIMTALGIVTGDKKKTYSPVCWGHAVLTLLFCIGLELDDIDIMGQAMNPVLLVSGFMIYGHIVGRNLGSDPSVEEVKHKKN